MRKCPYCDFNSHESRQQTPDQAYADALIADLEQALPLVWGRRVQSIFFGGGTPSLMSPEVLNDLLARLRMLLPLAIEAEITLEANPGTVEAERFAAFRNAGITRLSLGIQSFNDKHLLALGRIHDAREARAAVELALATFDQVNLDLMYALPEQTMAQALADVRTAIDYGPAHISAYHLTLEPNTAFHRTPPSLPDDDSSAAMQEAIENELAQAGYQHYETSAFARPGSQCRHNRNYWEFGDYLGIGAGAHSKLTLPDRILRQARTKHPAAYLKSVHDNTHIESERILTADDLGLEFMLNTLRLLDGFEPWLFEERTGRPLSSIEPALAEAQNRGLLNRSADRIAPTLLGQRFLNELLQLFLH
ncbi:oxygen-independent coproporphyrinogen-III oxidase-like protein YqeR [mine drainage metagenome]|uniref:Oxygen-independent coproporphyrinogen-III oxidase-like protein YqeR n=1 Tax=mine drainage metagenome TaxID=410659 RepID=A0A1J5QW93_9ZZZZ